MHVVNQLHGSKTHEVWPVGAFVCAQTQIKTKPCAQRELLGQRSFVSLPLSYMFRKEVSSGRDTGNVCLSAQLLFFGRFKGSININIETENVHMDK